MAENTSGYGDYDVYCADFEDAPAEEVFAKYNRIASSIVDFLCGRLPDAENSCIREAVHWQIHHMRGRGSVEACFAGTPVRESFGGYTVERAASAPGQLRLFGMEVSPVTVQILRAGGMMCSWI